MDSLNFLVMIFYNRESIASTQSVSSEEFGKLFDLEVCQIGYIEFEKCADYVLWVDKQLL